MKRIITLLMAGVMVLGAASLAAAAVEFKTSGHMHINFSLVDNAKTDVSDAKWNSDGEEDNFIVAQRFRPKLTMKADGVTAVFEAQQHQSIWGDKFDANTGKPMDIRIREAYVNFKLPSTPISLKVGYQQLDMPSIWGNPVLRARVGAVVGTVPFNDQVALTAFWAQPGTAANANATPPITANVRGDIGGAMLPLNFGTAKVTPYALYYNTIPFTLIFGGAHVQVMPTDALSIKADIIASSHSSDEDGGKDLGTGFMIAAAVNYELPWGTPGAFLWYATGEDEDGEGAFQSLYTDGFGPTSWGFKGTNTWGYDGQISTTGASTAAVGVQLANLSFVDGLKHTARVAYIMGTADEDAANGFTTKDCYIEGNFDSNWSIYENLAAVLELGVVAPSFDDNAKADDPAMKAQLTLRFTF